MIFLCVYITLHHDQYTISVSVGNGFFANFILARLKQATDVLLLSKS